MKSQCPNYCGDMVTMRNKSVEFYDGEHEVELDILIEICPQCNFVSHMEQY